jgi:large subunit ribosomal protein L4
MIRVAVYNRQGKEVETLKVDEAALGGKVRYPLLKQAVVMYQVNKRVGTSTTKGRSMVEGSGQKLFRQKGTGNARIGNIRTGKRVGGGMTFAKVARDFGEQMPKKQRRLARDSAILGKLLSENVVVVDELGFEKPKTKEFSEVLGNLKIDRSCLVTIADDDANVYKSARNIPRIDVTVVSQLNAGDICNHKKLLFTKDALMRVIGKDKS